ncbi:MAG: LytR C-terminal domain-containing protein [Candidatus Nanopelagicales bacterium]
MSLPVLILLTLVGMGVLFGVGFGLGQLLLSGDSSTASGGGTASAAASPSAQPCVTVQATPSSIPTSDITVDVLNSGAAAGSAKTAAEQLGAAGFVIGNVANGQSSQTGSPALVRYGPGGVDKARTVAAWVNGDAAMEEDATLGGSVQLVLLPAYSGIAGSEAAQAKLSQPVPVASGPGCAPSAQPAASAPAASQQPAAEASSGAGDQSATTSGQSAGADSGQGTQTNQ